MKRLSDYINFVNSHHGPQDKCILKGVLWQSPVPPPWPSKYPMWGLMKRRSRKKNEKSNKEIKVESVLMCK